MKAKGLDTGGKVLAKAISYRPIPALRIQARIGKIVRMGREKAARVWRLPAPQPLNSPCPTTNVQSSISNRLRKFGRRPRSATTTVPR